MPATRIPNTVNQQPQGGANPAPVTSGGRVARPPVSLQRGPGQAFEQFNDPALPDGVNRQLNTLQAALSAALQQIKSNPFADSNLIRGVQFTSGAQLVIKHGLPRAYTGWCLRRVRLAGAGTATIVELPNPDAPTSNAMTRTPSTLDKTQITFLSQGTFTADVEVY